MTLEELQIVIKTVVEQPKQQIERVKQSIQSINQTAQQAAAAPITKTAQNQLNRLQQSLDATTAKIKQKEAEMAQLFAKQDTIINKYRDFPAVSGMTKDQTVDTLVSNDTGFQKLDMEIAKLQTQLDPLNSKLAMTKQQMVGVTSQTNQFGSQVKKAASSVKDSVKKTQSATKETRKLGSEMKKTSGRTSMAGRMIKRMLISLLLFQSVRKIIQGITEGFKNLAQYSDTTNKAISNLQSSFLYAKNALAAAFAPALQALEPILTMVIDKIAEFFNWVAMLGAALSGQQSVVVAKKAQTDYAASINNTTKAMKGQLAAFDELNVLEDPSDSSSSSGTPGVSEMFETVEVPHSVNGFIDGIKAEFTKFGDWLKNFSPSFTAWDGAFTQIGTSWDGAKKRIQNGVKNLQTGGFGQLGNYLSNTFAPNVANSFSKAFAPIIGDTVSLALDELGKDVEFASIKINEVSEDILQPTFKRIETAATSAFSSIGNTWKQYGGSLIEGFKQFKESLRQIWDTLYQNVIKPVADSIGKTWDWLWKNHLEPFVQNASNFFASVGEAAMAVWNNALGPFVNWLIQTVGPGIASVFGGIGDVIGGVVGVIVEVFSSVFKAGEGLMNFITGVFTNDWEKAWKGIQDFFDGIWQGMVRVFQTIVNLVVDGLNLLWKNIYSVFNGIANGIGGAIGWIGSLFGQEWGFSLPHNPPLIPKWQIATFATGGIVSGPTLGLMGEYPGAHSNPEIIAPQSTMRETFLASLIPMINVLEEGFDRVVQSIDDKDTATYFEGRPLARAMKPFLDSENTRVGNPIFAR